MPNSTQTVPNMIQGVSQQAAQSRRATQCEAQFDCLNQPVEGCVPRPGFEVVKKLASGDFRDCFTYDIKRDKQERYQVIIKDGVLRVFNYLDGTACTVTSETGSADYLTLPEGRDDWNSFAATTAEDNTFIANKTVSPQMGDARSPSRPKEALFYFKAGGYKVTYTIRIKLSGTWFEWTYETPDNSVEANAQYITTDAICFALYNAMVVDVVNSITDDLHFNIARSGNIIRLWRTDALDFDIETIDGLSNTQLLSMKGTVGGFDKLPINGFDGMVFKVDGDKTQEADDYFVRFTSRATDGDSTTDGVWEEVVAPDTLIELDATTMPHTLINTALNTFTFGPGEWGRRLAGDGIDSAKDPSFVTRFIEDIFYDQSRLGIMTKASNVWSRVNNPFVFFPDTVQSALATAPIDVEIKASKQIAILHHPLQTAANTFLYGEGRQFAVQHGDNSTFSAQTIEVQPSTAYEWNDAVPPLPVGTSVIFGVEIAEYTTFTDATYRGVDVLGDTGIADHVPNYVPKNVRWMLGSDTMKKLVFYSEETPSHLYMYEYRISNQERLQSAWNTWRLPADSHILAGIMDKNFLYLTVARPDGMYLLRMSLATGQQDPEGSYLTRLDMRITEATCTRTYHSISDTTTIVLPYTADDTPDYETLEGNLPYVLAIRTTTEAFYRGTDIAIEDISTVAGVTTLTIKGNVAAATFYGGFRIRGERTESPFYVRSEQAGYVYKDRLQLVDCALSHSKSGYFRAEVLKPSGAIISSYPFEGRVFGDPANVYDQVVLTSGTFQFGVKQKNEDCLVRFVNDTFLPCSWQGLVWSYQATLHAQPGSQ